MKNDVISQSNKNLYVSKKCDYWCAALTRSLKDIQVFPKIRSVNNNFYEIIAFISTQNYSDKRLKRKIRSSMARLNYVNNLTILSESPGKALVYFTLKDKKKSLTNSFSKYYDIYDKIDYICEVRNGQENWLFSGPEIYINELKNNLDYSNLNDNLILSKENTMKDEIDMQKSLYLALGLDEEISTVLSVAKISGLLSNPADNKIRYITSRILGISSEQLMCMIEDGMIRSMWLIESIHKMERRLYYNRKGLKQKSETPYTGLSNDMFFGNDEIKKLLTQRSSHGCIYTFFNYMKVMFESAFAIMGISTSQKTSLMFYHPYFSICKKAVVRLANTIM